MKRTSRLVLITLIFTLPLALIGSVKAGTCPAPGPACYEYWKTDVVFVGIVTEISHPEIAEGENWAPASLARFSVEDAFRGVKRKEIEIAASIRRAGNTGLSTDGMGTASRRANAIWFMLTVQPQTRGYGPAFVAEPARWRRRQAI